MLYLLTMCVDSKLFGVVWFPEKTCFSEWLHLESTGLCGTHFL